MIHATLLTTVFLALAVAANPVVVKRSLVTLPVSRSINLKGKSILEHDQLRAQALRTKGEAIASGVSRRSAVISSQATNEAVSYIASIGVGSPPTQCK